MADYHIKRVEFLIDGAEVVIDGAEVLIDRAEVERRVCLTRATIYKYMRHGDFPLPLKTGPKAVRWRLSEITAWMDRLPRATGNLVFSQTGIGSSYTG